MGAAGAARRGLEGRDRLAGRIDHAAARPGPRIGDLDQFRRVHHAAKRGARPRIGHPAARLRARALRPRSRPSRRKLKHAVGLTRERFWATGRKARRPSVASSHAWTFRRSRIFSPRCIRRATNSISFWPPRNSSRHRSFKSIVDVAPARQSRAAAVAHRRHRLVVAAVSRLRSARQFQPGHCRGRGLGALSVASAIFLILEFSHPYSGIFSISGPGIDQVLGALIADAEAS